MELGHLMCQQESYFWTPFFILQPFMIHVNLVILEHLSHIIHHAPVISMILVGGVDYIVSSRFIRVFVALESASLALESASLHRRCDAGLNISDVPVTHPYARA